MNYKDLAETLNDARKERAALREQMNDLEKQIAEKNAQMTAEAKHGNYAGYKKILEAIKPLQDAFNDCAGYIQNSPEPTLSEDTVRPVWEQTVKTYNAEQEKTLKEYRELRAKAWALFRKMAAAQQDILLQRINMAGLVTGRDYDSDIALNNLPAWMRAWTAPKHMEYAPGSWKPELDAAGMNERVLLPAVNENYYNPEIQL